MIYYQHDNEMEIRSDMWQCVFATCLFVILALIPVYAILCLLFPAYFPSKEHLELVAWSIRFRDMLILLLPGIVGFYVYRSTVRYRLYFNREGIGQSDGFRNAFVKWEVVSSYTVENIGSYKDRLIELVLRDINAHTVFKPIPPTVTSTRKIKNERAQFWKKVADIMESKGSIY